MPEVENLITAKGGVTSTVYAVTGLPGATAGARCVGSVASGPPTTGTFLTGDRETDQLGITWLCAAGGSPGTWVQGQAGKPLGRMTIFGDSLASDYGATITDWGVSHKLGELLSAAQMRNQAISGAALASNSVGTVGDGGAIYLNNQLPRQELTFAPSAQSGGYSTLLTNAPTAGAGKSVTVTAGTGANYAVGDIVSLGGTTPEQTTVTAVATDTLTMTLANAHAIGDPLVRGPMNYLPLEQVAMLVYGINDILNLGPDYNGPTNPTLQPYANALRSAIARTRCSVVFEDNHPAIVYGANWTPVTGTTASYSGGTAHTTTTAGSSFTILIPGDCPATHLVFGLSAGASGNGANWTISASGAQFSTFTFDTRNANYFKYNTARGAAGDTVAAAAVRVAVPAANGTPYKITVTATTITGTAAFDWFGFEAAPNPPYVIVTKENRPYTINQTTTPYASRAATTLSAGSYPAGTTSWTVGSATGWKIGDTIKIGTGATSDTLTVSNIVALVITTSAGSTNAHSIGDAVQAGFQDADVTGVSANFSTGAADGGAVNLGGLSLNGRIQAVCNEFDSYVGVFDKDATLQRNAAWFLTTDGVHYNNQGHTELAIALYTWINQQIPLTTRELGSANVPAAKAWIPAGKGYTGSPAFQNSWANYTTTTGYYPLQFYKDVATGVVYIAGAVQGGTSSTAIITTLPQGYRPAAIVVLNGESDNGPCTLHVDSGGNLYGSSNCSTTFTSFYGVFAAEQ